MRARRGETLSGRDGPTGRPTLPRVARGKSGSSSWLKRSQFSTHSAHKALLAFERARKSANEKSTAAGAAAKKKISRKRGRKPDDVASDDSDGDDEVDESESD